MTFRDVAGILAVGLVAAPAVGASADPCADIDRIAVGSIGAADLLDGLARIEARLGRPPASGRCEPAAPALSRLVARLSDAGEWDAAARACRLLGGMGGLRGDDLLACARPYATLGALSDARRLLDDYVAEAGPAPARKVQAALTAAGVFEGAARFSAAADMAGVAATVAPSDADVLRRHVRYLLQAGRAEEASRTSEAALRAAETPSSTALARDLAVLFVRHEEPARAVAPATWLASRAALSPADLDAIATVAEVAKLPELGGRAAERFVAGGADKDRANATREAVGTLERHGLSDVAARLLRAEIDRGMAASAGDWLHLGRLLVVAGKPDDATAAFARSIEREGAADAAMLRVAEEWFRAGRPSRVVDLLAPRLEQGVVRSPDLCLALGRALHETGDDRAESEAYRKVAAATGDAGDLWLRVGDSLLARPDPARAYEAYAEASRLAREPAQAALAHVGLAEAGLALRRTERADVEKNLLSALAAAGGNALVVKRVERVSNRMGPSAGLLVAVLERQASAEPGRAETWLRLANAYIDSSRRTEALGAYRQYLKTSDEPKAALRGAVGNLLKGGHNAAAVRLVQGAVASGNVAPDVAESVGKACLTLGDRRCALRYLGMFLDGSLSLQYDYVGLADALSRSALFGLAGRSLGLARRALPRDRHWEIDLAEGTLEVLRGRDAAADESFRKAADGSTRKRVTLLSIAKVLQDARRLEAAAGWYRKAMGDPDAAFRAQTAPAAIEVLHAIGRDDEIREMIAGIPAAAWKNLGALKNVASRLGAAGMWSDAAALVASTVSTLGARVVADLVETRAGLLIRAGSFDAAYGIAEAACAGLPADLAAEVPCRKGVAVLASSARPELAVRLLKATASRGAATTALRLDLALLLLGTGEVDAGIAEVEAVVDVVKSVAEVTDRAGATLLGLRRFDACLHILGRLAARPGFAWDHALLLDTGRAHLGAGNLGGAMLAFQTYASEARGGVGRVVQELSAAGFLREAWSFAEGASPEAVAALDSGVLASIVEEMLRYGNRNGARVLLERYVEGNDGIPAAREVAAGVLVAVGRHAEAVEAFGKVLDGKLTGPGRAAYIAALWSTGARARALDVAIRGVSLAEITRERRAAPAWIDETVAFFLSEGAHAEALALLDQAAGPYVLSPGARFQRATLLANSGTTEGLEAGRIVFLDALDDVTSLPPEGFEFLRALARRKGLAGLADQAVAEAVTPARYQAAIFASCLAGEDAPMRKALAGLTLPEDVADAGELVLAGTTLTECGRWADAHVLAVRAIGAPAASVEDTFRGARLAIVTARLTGQKQPKDVLDRLVARTEDRSAQAALAADISMVSGDVAAAAHSLAKASSLRPGDSSAALAAVEAALHAGDDASREASAARLVGAATDRRDAVSRLATLYRRYLRDDLASAILSDEAAAWRSDRSLLWTAFESAARAGLPSAAEAAARYEGLFPGRPEASAEVVRELALQMDDAGIAARIDRFPKGRAGRPFAEALVEAALASFRAGDEAGGRALAGRAVEADPWPGATLSRVGQMVVNVPSVPSDVLDSLLAAAGKAAGDAESLPWVTAARCVRDLAKDPGAATRCMEAVESRRYLPFAIVSDVAARLLSADAFEAASRLAGVAAARDRSVRTRRGLAARIVARLGQDRSVPADRRKELGRLGLSLSGEEAATRDPGLAPLTAHLLELADGVAAAEALYRKELAVSPSDAGLRNNLAYVLSIAGGDLQDALREVRIARTLSYQGSAFYLETEAWARFMGGDAAEALKMQGEARRFWNLEQGGGIAESLVHLGRMLEAARRMDDARECYRRAAVLEPGEWAGAEAVRLWRALLPRQPGTGSKDGR